MRYIRNNKIYFIGIITCIIYFIFVALFIILKKDLFLTFFEISTIIGGFVVYLVNLNIMEDFSIGGSKKTFISGMSLSMLLLTTLAHTVSLMVIRPLISKGIDLPEYFQIGKWPSIEMSVDYLAWGFFMGLSDIGFFIAIKNNKVLRNILLMMGCLCLLGFIGSMINENLWYMAPLSYGFGTVIVCLKMIRIKKEI